MSSKIDRHLAREARIAARKARKATRHQRRAALRTEQRRYRDEFNTRTAAIRAAGRFAPTQEPTHG